MFALGRWAPPVSHWVKLYFVVGVLTQYSVDALYEGWKVGRATYYGERHDGSTDGFSIHHGSCQFGRLDPNVGTGWDIAAMSDMHVDFLGSCGRCYELACVPMLFHDNYGEHLDRTDACVEGAKTIIVTVADSCPCDYPLNKYNNKRWCCGDMDHFDLSLYAFEKLAKVEKGVFGLKYRPVPCPATPGLEAPVSPSTLVIPPFPSPPPEHADGPTRADAMPGTPIPRPTFKPIKPEEDLDVKRDDEKDPSAAVHLAPSLLTTLVLTLLQVFLCT